MGTATLEVPQGCNVCQESKTTRGTKELFLKAVSVWINKPHVANRRLCGSTILRARRCLTKTEVEALSKSCSESSQDLTSWEAGHSFKELSEENSPYLVLVRELVPKSEFFPRLREAIVYDKEKASVTFSPLHMSIEEKEAQKVFTTKEISYTIQFKETDEDMPGWAQVNEVAITWNCECGDAVAENPRCQMTSSWLRSKLLGKVVSWSEVNDITTSAKSLLLVPVDKYKDTYIRLKNAYGRDLVKTWPERTDPKKFVYEDVAIAAYLLLIWEEDRQLKGLNQKQSFVDLGCGNGLLVYILTKEGHKGLGIDLRKRNIWDMFGPDINLREETIKPSSEYLFPEYDWVIGNHSDELTPWIPVIAARSSPTCSFFVLPCCHHDFVGKFCDTQKGQSRYGTYVNYIKEVVEHCGFSPEVDTLRIPSTKRICLIGRQRMYTPDTEEEADVRRQAFIDKRIDLSQHQLDRVHRMNSVSSSSEPSSPVESVTPQSSTECHPFWDSGFGRQGSLNGDVDHTLNSPKLPKSFTRLASLESGYSSSAGSALGSLDSSNSQSMSPLPLSLSDYKIVPPAFNDMGDLQGRNGDLKRGCPELSAHDGQPITPDALSTDVDRTSSKRMRTDPHPEEAHAEKFESTVKHSTEVKWARGFQPRSEPGIRNCQWVPENVKSQIVNTVFGRVLEADDVDGSTVQLPEGKRWRKGGAVSLSEVASLFDKHTLQELKSECGGLQTLLRNHSQVFQVNGGQVRLRDFSQADPWKGSNPHKRQASLARAEQRDTRKTTLCWFHENHPDGCPRSSSDCSFAHGKGELRKKLSSTDQTQPRAPQIMVR